MQKWIFFFIPSLDIYLSGVYKKENLRHKDVGEEEIELFTMLNKEKNNEE